MLEGSMIHPAPRYIPQHWCHHLGFASKRTAKAIEEMSDVTPIGTRMRSEGRGLQDIADHLNDEGYVTRMGSTWSATQVMRILNRASRQSA